MGLNRRVWVRTKFAWYILDVPSRQYLPYFARMFVVHLFSHLLLQSAREDPSNTLDDFKLSLKITSNSSDTLASAVKVLGRGLTVEDLNNPDVVSSIVFLSGAC